MSARFGEVALLAHPALPLSPVRSLAASGSVSPSGRLRLEFDLRGDVQALRLETPGREPGRRDELWRRTCFECFAGQEAESRYLELNFSTSGDWAAYAFAAYRAPRDDLVVTEMSVTWQALGHDRLTVRAEADLGTWFAPNAPAADWTGWRLNVAAVIEDIHGALSYWALHHPRAQPDFHDRDGFRIALSAAPREFNTRT